MILTIIVIIPKVPLHMQGITEMPLTYRIQRAMLLERFFQHHGLFFRQPQLLPRGIAATTVVIVAPSRARGPLTGHGGSIIIVVPLALLAVAAAHARDSAVRRRNAVALRRRIDVDSSYHFGAPVCHMQLQVSSTMVYSGNGSFCN